MQLSKTNFGANIRVPIEISGKATTKANSQPEAAKIELSVEALAIAKLRTELSDHGISLRFSRDDTTDHLVVQMIDEKTGDPIRQFPTEVSLSLAANIMKLQGASIDFGK